MRKIIVAAAVTLSIALPVSASPASAHEKVENVPVAVAQTTDSNPSWIWCWVIPRCKDKK